MMLKPVSIWAVTACVLAAAAFGQDADDKPRRATEIPTAGFWPTDRMMNRIIDRFTDKMAEHYAFDDDQLETTRELFRANFPTFLNENRAEIQTLMNQYFEALLNKEPPSVEEVAEWAARIQPLLAEFGEVTHEVTEGMHEYMTDEQVTMLDAETAGFDTGMQLAQNKLSVWAAGGYDPETEWIYSAEEQDGDNQERAPETEAEKEAAEAASAEGEGAFKPAAKSPKDQWEVYTEKFIKRYKLNNEQKQKAYAFLRRRQEARDRYLQRKAAEMKRVSKQLTGAENEDERKAAVAAYDKLTAPVERMFQTLKDRLDTLPTRAQRKAAAAAEKAGENATNGGKEPPTSSPASPSDEDRQKLEPGQATPNAKQPTEDK